MDKYKNKYRIASIRADWWDYRWAGSYFITICTQDRRHYFGEIQDDKMFLSKAGILADVFWHEIPYHFQNVKLEAFVVMPNHIHGILSLAVADAPLIAETKEEVQRSFAQQRFQNQGANSVSSIIGSYKSIITKKAHKFDIEFGWQTRFYDHIIRDEAEYQHIENYIKNNPQNWRKDIFFKKEL